MHTSKRHPAMLLVQGLNRNASARNNCAHNLSPVRLPHTSLLLSTVFNYTPHICCACLFKAHCIVKGLCLVWICYRHCDHLDADNAMAHPPAWQLAVEAAVAAKLTAARELARRLSEERSSRVGSSVSDAGQ